MREYSLAERFALAGLNGQNSRGNTAAKKLVIKGIAMAEFLESLLDSGAASEKEEVFNLLNREVQKVRKLNKGEREKIERDMARRLQEEGALAEVPDLLGCDINYYTANLTMREYKSAEPLYRRITEGVRAEILEEGEVSAETVCLLYLFRECGCMHEFFSAKEQERVQERLLTCMEEDSFCRTLLGTEFHGMERVYLGFLKRKQDLFRNPYLQGVNLAFPFLERRQAIFIDMVILGTNVSDRREAAMEFVRKKGHSVEDVAFGREHLLKIDNNYYRIFPAAKRYYGISVQGISIVPAYV